MVCQKCGKDNLDNSIYCSSCGEKFDSEKKCENENQNIEENKETCEEKIKGIARWKQFAKKNKTVIAIISSILVVTIIIAIPSLILPAINYNKAISLMNEKKYEESKQIFDSLDDYKDSKNYLNKIDAILLFEQKKEEVKEYLGNGIAYNYVKVISTTFGELEKLTKSGTWNTETGKAEINKNVNIVLATCDEMLALDIGTESPVYDLNFSLQKSAVYYKKAMDNLIYGLDYSSMKSIESASTNIALGNNQFSVANDELTKIKNKYIDGTVY